MEKFDSIKMQELVKVIDPDQDGGLTLIFQNGRSLKIKTTEDGDNLTSEFVD